jgi:hypothetical protein
MRAGGLQVAAEAIAHDLAEARRRALEREHASVLIGWTDGLIEELELLNLQDVTRVSAEWQGWLRLLLAALPFGYQPSLPPYPWSPTQLLDTLFDVQSYLFDMKNGQLLAANSQARAS